MFKFLRNLFSSIFGGKKSRPTTGGTVSQPPPPEPKPEPETDSKTPKNLVKLRLERLDSSRTDTIGKLFWEEQEIARTLEGPAGGPPRDEKAIPSGTYPLILRTAGGMHGTYSFRFRDLHRGMLWIQDVPGKSFPFIKVGNRAEFAYGSVLLGNEHKDPSTENGPREVWNSESTYKKVYDRIAKHLEAGNDIQIEVVNPAVG